MRQSSTALNIKESRKIRDEEAEDHATIACDEIELALMLRLVFSLFSTASKNERVSLLKYTSSQVLGHCQLAQVGGNQSRRECLCDVALAVYVWGSNMK